MRGKLGHRRPRPQAGAGVGTPTAPAATRARPACYPLRMRRAARRREGPRTNSNDLERGRATQRHYMTTALAAHAEEPPATSNRQAASSKIVRNISHLGARHWFNIGARNADRQPAGRWATGARARAHRHKFSHNTQSGRRTHRGTRGHPCIWTRLPTWEYSPMRCKVAVKVQRRSRVTSTRSSRDERRSVTGARRDAGRCR